MRTGDHPEVPTLSKLISSAIPKAQLIEFLGLSQKTPELKAQLVEKLLALIGREDTERARFLETFKIELAVGPLELETLLHCSKTERQRWIREGKIPVLEYRSFRKAGWDMEYPVHDRRVVLGLSQEEIQQWREAHQVQVQQNRKAGAQVAIEARRANQQSRQTFLTSWMETVEVWKQQASPELAVAFELAFWTVWASRWAKAYQVKSHRGIKHSALYTKQKEVWYRRKNEAMQLLAQSLYARLSFYRPEDADKISLQICQEHWEMKREDFYTDKWEFYSAHRSMIKQCPHCFVNIEKDYYSLYYLEITAAAFPEMRFSFHMPYPVGRTFFPAPKKLRKVEHVEQDGIFRFGRPLFAEEKIIYREKDVLANFERALVEAKKIYYLEAIKEAAQTGSQENEMRRELPSPQSGEHESERNGEP